MTVRPNMTATRAVGAGRATSPRIAPTVRGLARILVPGAALVLAGAGVAVAQEPYPTSPPPAAPLEPPVFPPFQEARLSNGLQLVVVERHSQPVVSLSLAIPAGSAYDPAGKDGVAGMVAGLLTKGAGERGADQIADAIEGVGGSLSAGAGRDFLTIHATTLSPDAQLAFSLLADVTLRPTFPEAEVELARTQTLSGLQLQLSEPASLASRFFNQFLYGQHPYARSATPASVRGITRDDLVAFQRERLRPEGALLVVAGDMDLARARELAEESFGTWSGAAPRAASFPAPPARGATEIVLVHRPGSVQANIVVGNVAFGPADPLRYAATVANRILGGGADARLFTVLREEKGWTYGAYSGITRPLGPGSFQASAEVRTEVTDSALVEILAQLRSLRSQQVTPAELEAARGALVGGFPLTIQTADQVAGAVSQARLLGLGSDYLQQYPSRLAAVTAVDVEEAARAAIHPDSALIVVVGDGAKLYDRLADIATVRIISPEGDPITPAELTAPAAGVELDPAALVARVDSFDVMLQGQPFGFTTMRVEADADGFTITESSQLGPIVSQRTTIRLGTGLEMRSVKQEGTVQGQATSLDVTYAAGRATGSAAAPRPPSGAVESREVDAAVPGGVVDDNALTALVPALPWEAGAKLTLPVFASGQGELMTYNLAVTGTESVTVPAGTFQAYRVEVTGGPQPLTLLVEAAAPHRLLKVGMTGTPIELVRVP